MKVAVIAGTPVDTRMGVEYLRRRDPSIVTMPYPCAEDPRGCHLFQIAGEAEKKAHIEQIYRRAIEEGAERFFVYCNSLSSSVDFESISGRFGVRTATPMSAYGNIAEQYGTIGVLAANNQCTKGIEDRFTAVNRNGYVIGIGNLKLTEAVEQGREPAEIAESFDFAGMCALFRASGCEAIVLGCTHFPYFFRELAARTDLPVIDPADIMYESLTASER